MDRDTERAAESLTTLAGLVRAMRRRASRLGMRLGISPAMRRADTGNDSQTERNQRTGSGHAHDPATPAADESAGWSE